MAKFTPEEVGLLRKFVSDPEGNVFVVLPNAMPGMVGAAFARYSRARGGFRETLLREFIKEGQLDPLHADKLIDRILAGFGDDSVQEFESAHLGLEEISNLATKAIEDRRLGAYIEQSSRYVFYDQRDEQGRFRYLREPTIMASRHARAYEENMDFVFETYCRLIEPMQEYFRQRKPLLAAEYAIRQDHGKIHYADCAGDSERKAFEATYRADIRAKTCDTIRVLLPAATLTNLGMHTNGRTFELMLKRLYSSELHEFKELAEKARRALNHVVPRYVQRAEQGLMYLIETRRNMQALTDQILVGRQVNPSPEVEVFEPQRKSATALEYAAMLYPYSEFSLAQLAEIVRLLPPSVTGRIANPYIGNRTSRRDRPGRALEFGYKWNIDMVIDFGIFRDLHRHRMCTQERQLLTTRLGFVDIPEEIVEAGHADVVRQCVNRSAELYEAIRGDLGREIAQYVVLFGFKIRSFIGINDRAAGHLLELRTGPQGHKSYRRVCQDIARKMCDIGPWWTGQVLQFVDYGQYDWPRADSEARQRQKEARLDASE